MELLTILYAMLAALTGFSVGEAAPQRQTLVAAANAEAAVVAVVAAQDAEVSADVHGRHRGRLLARQDVLTVGVPTAFAFAAQNALFARINLGRWHL